jgi:hypothetical protein
MAATNFNMTPIEGRVGIALEVTDGTPIAEPTIELFIQHGSNPDLHKQEDSKITYRAFNEPIARDEAVNSWHSEGDLPGIKFAPGNGLPEFLSVAFGNGWYSFEVVKLNLQTGAGSHFSRGQKIFGNNSKARGEVAKIVSDSLYLIGCQGTFANNEDIYDKPGGTNTTYNTASASAHNAVTGFYVHKMQAVGYMANAGTVLINDTSAKSCIGDFMQDFRELGVVGYPKRVMLTVKDAATATPKVPLSGWLSTPIMCVNYNGGDGEFAAGKVLSTQHTTGAFKILVDGDAGGAKLVEVPLTGLTTGAGIATAIETAIQALGGVYAAVTATWNTGASGKYKITSGTTGASSSVVITDAAYNNIADILKLGTGHSGSEVVGNGGGGYSQSAGTPSQSIAATFSAVVIGTIVAVNVGTAVSTPGTGAGTIFVSMATTATPILDDDELLDDGTGDADANMPLMPAYLGNACEVYTSPDSDGTQDWNGDVAAFDETDTLTYTAVQKKYDQKSMTVFVKNAGDKTMVSKGTHVKGLTFDIAQDKFTFDVSLIGRTIAYPTVEPAYQGGMSVQAPYGAFARTFEIDGSSSGLAAVVNTAQFGSTWTFNPNKAATINSNTPASLVPSEYAITGTLNVQFRDHSLLTAFWGDEDGATPIGGSRVRKTLLFDMDSGEDAVSGYHHEFDMEVGGMVSNATLNRDDAGYICPVTITGIMQPDIVGKEWSPARFYLYDATATHA